MEILGNYDTKINQWVLTPKQLNLVFLFCNLVNVKKFTLVFPRWLTLLSLLPGIRCLQDIKSVIIQAEAELAQAHRVT